MVKVVDYYWVSGKAADHKDQLIQLQIALGDHFPTASLAGDNGIIKLPSSELYLPNATKLA